MASRVETVLWRVAIAAIYLFLFGPLLVIFVTSLNPDGISFPPTGVTAKWYLSMLGDAQLLDAFIISILVAVATSAVSIPLVVLVGLALRDGRIPGSSLLENFFLSPLGTPQVIIGLSLLIYFSSFNLVGSIEALVFGHLVITLPYALRTVLAALKNYDPQIEEAARNLGASYYDMLRYVTLPLIRPALIAGGGFAFVMSFTNFTISIFLVGPDTVTIPIQIFQYITFSIDPTVSAVAVVLAAISFLVALIIEYSFGVQDLSSI